MEDLRMKHQMEETRKKEAGHLPFFLCFYGVQNSKMEDVGWVALLKEVPLFQSL